MKLVTHYQFELSELSAVFLLIALKVTFSFKNKDTLNDNWKTCISKNQSKKKDPYGSFLFIHFNSEELARIIKHLEIPLP